VKTWYIARTKDGFQLDVCENSMRGAIIAEIIEGADLEWWGKYKNLPFCWINPWGWTFHVGTEEHNLGGWWMDVGNAVLNYAWKIKKERTVTSFPLTQEQVETLFPGDWKWFADTLDLEGEIEDDDQPESNPLT